MSRVTALFSVLLFVAGCKKHVAELPPQVVSPPSAPAVVPVPEVVAPASVHTQLARAYFSLDSATLSADAKRALAENAKVLAANPTVRLEVQGHCDERGTTEYNMALGQRRAQATRAYLASQGVAASRMSTVSFGEERPASMGSDEGAWGQNRRAELRLLTEVAGLEGSVR